MQNRAKTVLTFAAGMAAMAVVSTAVLPAAASGSQISLGQVGVRLFGEQVFSAGTPYTAPNGQKVPSSITYTDTAGGKTNYLPVRQVADLLDTEIGWDAATSSVEFAPSKPSDATVTQNPTPTDGSDFLTAPTYGQKIGAFEELDPSTVDAVKNPLQFPVLLLQDVRVQYHFTYPACTKDIAYAQGEYLVYTVTNNSQQVQTSKVYRTPTVSAGTKECFAEVTVQPGQTLTRVFRVAKDANPLAYNLVFDVGHVLDPNNRDAVNDVTVSVEQYFSQEQYSAE